MNTFRDDYKGRAILAGASFYNKKVFFDPDCADIPEGVKNETLDLCKKGAQMSRGVFQVGYTLAGEVVFISEGDENDAGYDEINARIITDKLIGENAELIKSIQLWHALYKTEAGGKLRKKLAKSDIFGGKP